MRWHFKYGSLFIYPLAKLLLRLKVKGKENLRTNGESQIIACNHSSNFDPFLLGLVLAHNLRKTQAKSEIFFLAKEELFQFSKSFRWLLESFNALAVSRERIGTKIFKKSSEILSRAGTTLVLFPEGTRSRNGRMLPFKSGLGHLAIKNRVPVIPTYIKGIANSFISKVVDSDIRRFRKVPLKRDRRRIYVRFGEPIYPNGFPPTKEGYSNFTAIAEKSVMKLSEE